MSLYYEAATIIEGDQNDGDSLKLSVFSTSKKLKSSRPQLYALLAETHKWNLVLNEVIEKSGLLVNERKLTTGLALVLVHDLLLSKKGIAAPVGHGLRSAVERHKVRLQAELTKLRIRDGHANLESLKRSLADSSAGNDAFRKGLQTRPRWIRVNTLKTNLNEQLRTTFKNFKQIETLEAVLEASIVNLKLDIVFIDIHIPDLLAIPASHNVTTWKDYRNGSLILQDKASCFPAYLIYPKLGDVLLDACAAPGNKTTHVSALLEQAGGFGTGQVWACERDESRAELLRQMVEKAHATEFVTIKAAQDFLGLDPTTMGKTDGSWIYATAIILDPSCSGSGIIGRDDCVGWKLPENKVASMSRNSSKKRKRGTADGLGFGAVNSSEEENKLVVPNTDSALQSRLRALAAIQLRLLLHAFSFPMVQRITYSTCSVYEDENEQVVISALSSPVAIERGWRILSRRRQVEGMQKWHLRGHRKAFDGCDDADELAEGCIRCAKSTADGTQGFFVAAFYRTIDADRSQPNAAHPSPTTRPDGCDTDTEEEWGGISDASG